MKNTLNISSYILNPKGIGEEGIKQLTQELKSMPWCAAYRVLLAKGYDNENSFQKNRHLRLAATYVGDREQLFLLTHDQAKQVAQVDFQENVLVTTTVEDVVEQTADEVKRISGVEDATLDLERVGDDVLKLEGVQNISEESLTQESKIDFDEIVKYDPIKELKIIETPIKRKSEKIDFDYVAYNPEKELSKLVAEKEEKESHDFMFWLNHMEDDKEAIIKSSKSAKSPDKVQDLLDQFLATKRSRPIQNRQFYNAQNKAEESETDDMGVLSVTLLELYVKQGHTSKAIKGYQKLSLQNPSKSAYFAARIKELEENKKDL
ncbi:MAG: hypothetical protein COA58_06070 [Bacteroidetes bacterium]|nr:MAG: hypothetical protein COA58_06070 [Bacteroidota bacterium]